MKTEEYIHDFICKEKELTPNPFISTRVMEKIKASNTRQKSSTPYYKVAILAASLAGVIFLGITIGNTYKTVTDEQLTMNINDQQIESLYYYNSEDYE